MKKKFILLFGMILSFISIAPVYAVNVQGSCNDFSTTIDVKLPHTVHLIILAIEIAVPVVLVIFGMLDLFRGITAQKEDEIKKGQQTFIKRLLAAALVFFVIIVVKLLIGFAAGSEKTKIINCANCFINGVNQKTGICNEW